MSKENNPQRNASFGVGKSAGEDSLTIIESSTPAGQLNKGGIKIWKQQLSR